MDDTLVINASAKRGYAPDRMSVNVDFIIKDKELTNIISKRKELTSKIVATFSSMNEVDLLFKNDYISDASKEKEERYYVDTLSYQFNIDLDIELYERILKLLDTFKTEVNISVSYGLKDYKKAQEEVLSLAFKQADEKASLIASLTHRELGGISHIEYTTSQQPLSLLARANFSSQISIKPLEIYESLSVTYRLK